MHKITPICAFHSRSPFPVRTFLTRRRDKSFYLYIFHNLILRHVLYTSSQDEFPTRHCEARRAVAISITEQKQPQLNKGNSSFDLSWILVILTTAVSLLTPKSSQLFRLISRSVPHASKTSSLHLIARPVLYTSSQDEFPTRHCEASSSHLIPRPVPHTSLRGQHGRGNLNH